MLILKSAKRVCPKGLYKKSSIDSKTSGKLSIKIRKSGKSIKGSIKNTIGILAPSQNSTLVY